MTFIEVIIHGIPYPENKAPSKVPAKEWEADVVEQTRHLERIKDACAVEVTFFLPADRFSADEPNGPDLDNLLKRFIRSLEKTVFSEAVRQDSCIVALSAKKVKVSTKADKTGARLRIAPSSLDTSSRLEN